MFMTWGIFLKVLSVKYTKLSPEALHVFPAIKIKPLTAGVSWVQYSRASTYIHMIEIRSRQQYTGQYKWTHRGIFAPLQYAGVIETAPNPDVGLNSAYVINPRGL